MHMDERDKFKNAILEYERLSGMLVKCSRDLEEAFEYVRQSAESLGLMYTPVRIDGVLYEVVDDSVVAGVKEPEDL